MSVRALSAAFEESRATDSAFVVLLAMADWADQNGRCYPSYGQIAEKARVSRASAIEGVRKLIKLGEIERVEQGKAPDESDDESPANVRSQWRNLYRIVLVRPRAQGVQNSDHLENGRNGAQVVQPSDPLGDSRQDAGSPINTPQVVQPTDPHIRSRPSDRPSVLKAGAAPRSSEKKTDDDDPEKNLHIITRLAHEVLDLVGLQADLGDIADALKTRCSHLRVAYTGDLIRRAVDSAIWLRQHPSLARAR